MTYLNTVLNQWKPYRSNTQQNKKASLALIAFTTLSLLLAVNLGVYQNAHAAPSAGTSIGNQASATYVDDSSVSRSVTSNTVSTIIQQVVSLTLSADGSKSVAPGSTVYFPHTLTNTGNGTDTFNFSTGSITNFTSTAIYADADGDGLPDNTTIISSATLAEGEIYKFVVAASVAGTASNGTVATLDITTTSTFGATPPSASNTDTATVNTNAVINVTKAIDDNTGAPSSGPYTYTLTYTNNGNATATNLSLSDTIPAGMSIVNNSGTWSVGNLTGLTDADDGTVGAAPESIAYDYNVSTAGAVTAVISQVAAGQSGTITFQVNVDASLTPQTINNTANYSYNDGVAAVATSDTNTVAFTVEQSYGATMSGETIASATQGSTISFTNTVINTGNGSDSFDISLSGQTFPAGSTYQLFQSDGLTPLLDTNGNGIPDTGPVAGSPAAPNNTYDVVLKVTLPAGATGGPYSATKTATSFADPATTPASANTTDTLTAITANTVDLTNNVSVAGGAAAGDGLGVGQASDAAFVTNSTDPGTTTRFTLYVNNTSGVADNYDLSVYGSFDFTTTSMPSGWSVSFKNASETVITNTGTIAANGNLVVYADISVPTGYVPGTVDVYFRALSPTSSAGDIKRDAVTVNTINDVNISPNNSGQVFEGGSVVYTHTIQNNGNVDETGITLALNDDQSGWTSVVYEDTNGDGVLTSADSAISSIDVTAGNSATLFVKVFAPSGATSGTVDTTTLTATYTGAATATATESTTVIAGNVSLEKKQALDSDCDGVISDETVTTFAATSINALPGQCIRYEITATNIGSADADTIVVSDATPTYTTYHATVAAATTVGTISAPTADTAGTVTATVGTLTPSQSAVITFGVRVEQ